MASCVLLTQVCLGGKPVYETLLCGASTFHEPNQGVDYEVRAWWEGATFVAERTHPTVNSGRPTVKRVYIDEATGELRIDQTWGGCKKGFNAAFSRK